VRLTAHAGFGRRPPGKGPGSSRMNTGPRQAAHPTAPSRGEGAVMLTIRRFLASDLALQDACSLLPSPSSLGSDSGRGGGWSLSRGLRGASARVPAGRCRGQSRPCQHGRPRRQDDPHPSLLRQAQVTLAEHDRLRWAQGGVAQAGVERFQVRSPIAEPPDGGQQVPGPVSATTPTSSPGTATSATLSGPPPSF
jgi:hypothetical protein